MPVPKAVYQITGKEDQQKVEGQDPERAAKSPLVKKTINKRGKVQVTPVCTYIYKFIGLTFLLSKLISIF